MKEYFASPPRERASELEQARMRKVLQGAPARPRPVSDNSDAIVSEVRAMRSEMESLRELIERGSVPANDEILTRKQTADLLHVCIESITKLVKDEGLPCKRVGKKEYRFLRSQVLAWLASCVDAQPSGED